MACTLRTCSKPLSQRARIDEIVPECLPYLMSLPCEWRQSSLLSNTLEGQQMAQPRTDMNVNDDLRQTLDVESVL